MADLRTIIAIDQGTTSSRAILFDDRHHPRTPIGRVSAAFPADGWLNMTGGYLANHYRCDNRNGRRGRARHSANRHRHHKPA